MSGRRFVRHKGVAPLRAPSSANNSLDWYSPYAKTGTVKRRPVSGECLDDKEPPHNFGDGGPGGRQVRLTTPSGWINDAAFPKGWWRGAMRGAERS